MLIKEEKVLLHRPTRTTPTGCDLADSPSLAASALPAPRQDAWPPPDDCVLPPATTPP